MKTLAVVSRKVGFGFRPGDPVPLSADEWLEEQLGLRAGWPCLRSDAAGAKGLGPWPDAPDLSLAGRVQRLRTLRTHADAIDARALPDAERAILRERNRAENTVTDLDQLLFLQAAVYGQDQIRLRLAQFWLNHFTVGQKETTGELIGDYWKSAIYDRLDGRFGDLLHAATTHPAMVTYLDNIYNIGTRSPKAAQCTGADCVVGINDNLGRELLELHSLSPARGYTEADIHEAARVLAGWGNIFDRPFHTEPDDYSQPWEAFHAEAGDKVVLGWPIPSGRGGLRVLTDHLAGDAATIRHLSRKLAVHFIGSGATDADLRAIEAVWHGTKGALPAIHRTVLRLAMASDARRFHWPLTWAVQVLRLSGGHLLESVEDLNQPEKGSVQREAAKLMQELGNSFWSERQPNGFSDTKADWVSTEHMDRRVRFAGLVHDHAEGRLPVDAILAANGFSRTTAALLDRGRDERQRFLLLMCSPEMMEV